MGLHVGGHAAAGVGHGQHDISTRPHFGVLLNISGAELDVGGFQAHPAALGHGVAGVHHQVHDNLLDLSGVRGD